jgi:hypothetical protein
MHGLIDIGLWGMTEKMKVISHENKSVNGEVVFFMCFFETLEHDGPNLSQWQWKKFLIITP